MLWRLQGGMLLDCGEGTYGQLRRRYGAATDEIIAGLKCVWISHIHADHHAGLGRLSSLPVALQRAYLHNHTCTQSPCKAHTAFQRSFKPSC